MTKKADSPEAKIRAAALELSRLRERPCLVFIDPHIAEGSAKIVRQAIEPLRTGTSLDVVVISPGGHLEWSYIIVRALRRKCHKMDVFVPSGAKSAATLICLAGDDLILGEFGELGPLDSQVDEKQRGDVPAHKSSLERFKSLEQLREYSEETFKSIVKIVLDNGGMKLIDACKVATDFTGKICGPLYGQIAPESIGISARHLEVGEHYTHRVLSRYRRSTFDDDERAKLVEQLVWGYPSHDFIIDIEELQHLNVPARTATDEESELLSTFEQEAGLLGEGCMIAIFDATASKMTNVADIKPSPPRTATTP